MGFEEGLNYFFLHSDEDSTIRIESDVNPFYSISKQKLEKIPSLYSDPTVIPRFHYNVRWNRRNYISREILTPSKNKNPNWEFGSGSAIQNNIQLDSQVRNQMISTRYLSLRDIVNPSFNEADILREIDKLYYKPQDKNTLSQLVKILYSGTPKEEREIVQSLFSYEKEFALFLTHSIFNIEILPLIHGLFLQEVLTKMDERIIKNGLRSLSPPVIEVIRKSVSRNKFQDILNSPSIEAKDDENIQSIIESILFSRFSKKIYYEKGQYTVLKIPNKGIIENPRNVQLIDASRFQWSRLSQAIDFMGATKTELLILVNEWMEAVRIDILINTWDIESFEYFRLSPGIILRIPFYPTGRCVIIGGILRKNISCEFYLSNRQFY